ncbi:MAG: transposase [Promethearchaeota archaeon]|nr:MAG: transposase [Candidatus Lokiarchaeota archaeon]
MASIDINVNNIVAMADNIGSRPIIVKGGVVKSINQFFNKERARLMSAKDKQGYTHWTKKLTKLSLVRYNKLHDVFHKLSRNIVEHCVENDIGTLVIGYNATWKQEVNMGKRNNQNFVSIPFLMLIDKIQYKAELIGIHVILQEESYTSKCSFLDREDIGWHYQYKGLRLDHLKKRGLFRASDGRIINADINAALNIMRKAIPNVKFAKGIEDIVLRPRCVSWY